MKGDNAHEQKDEDKEEEDDDEVLLDSQFFTNENYQIQKFTFGTEAIEAYGLQSSLTDYDLTGQMVWPGAEVLTEYLLQKRTLLEGASLLELGAGLGLSGLICARYCKHVVLTDYHEMVLKVMQMNVDHQFSASTLPNCNVQVHKLEWGSDGDLEAILEKHPKGFNLVMGADICYQQTFLTPLFTTISHLMKRGQAGSTALLAYVSRTSSMDAAVVGEASKLSLELREVSGTRKRVAGGLYEGWIYEIVLKATL